MTTNTELTRRWLYSKHWGGWRVGMQSQLGWLCIDEGIEPDHRADWPWPIPNLNHPGTRAFLLEDVRRAWGRAVAVVMPCDRRPEFAAEIERSDEWPVFWHRYTGNTEAAALVAALESAP